MSIEILERSALITAKSSNWGIVCKTLWGAESVLRAVFESVLLFFSVLNCNWFARRFGLSKTLLQDGFRVVLEKRLANKSSYISSLRRQQDGKTLFCSVTSVYIRVRAHAHVRAHGAEFFPEKPKSVLLSFLPSLAVSS